MQRPAGNTPGGPRGDARELGAHRKRERLDSQKVGLTCEGEEHPGRTEQVVPALSEGEDHAEAAQDHEEEAEDGDGRRGDVVL